MCNLVFLKKILLFNLKWVLRLFYFHKSLKISCHLFLKFFLLFFLFPFKHRSCGSDCGQCSPTILTAIRQWMCEKFLSVVYEEVGSAIKYFSLEFVIKHSLWGVIYNFQFVCRCSLLSLRCFFMSQNFSRIHWRLIKG